MAKKSSLYSVSPGVKMMQDWIATLKQKTGRSLEEWLMFVKKHGPPTEKERRDWLKAEHGLGTNSAWWIAERAEGKGTEEDDPETYLKTAEKYVDDMFAEKPNLKPIYDALLKLGLGVGKDSKACPCKTIVPFYRKHVFAQIKPSTRTRIDFGLALRDTKPTGKLIDTGGFAKKDRISHRFAISSLDDIDAEVKRWLKRAYDMDG
jgi:hypothetical protein